MSLEEGNLDLETDSEEHHMTRETEIEVVTTEAEIEVMTTRQR